MALGAASLAAACSDPKGEVERKWICFESSSCSCHVVKPNTVSGGSDKVDACFDTSCCLLTQSSKSDLSATCECLPDIEDCDAEASSRRGVEVVTQCPPAGEAPESKPAACAAAGENCRQSYLAQNELAGCCEGTLCKSNASGIPVCQAATAEEQSLLEECNHAAATQADDTIHLVTPTIETSMGTLALGEPQFAFFGVGPGGCLNSFDLTLGTEIDCKLRMNFDPLDGRLALTSFGGNIAGCAGYTGEPLSGYITGSTSEVAASLSFEGVACDGRLIFESYCIDGSFELTLDGAAGDLSFDAQTITLQGALCTAEPEGECPAP
jgi:hypothetical protein